MGVLICQHLTSFQGNVSYTISPTTATLPGIAMESLQPGSSYQIVQSRAEWLLSL